MGLTILSGGRQQVIGGLDWLRIQSGGSVFSPLSIAGLQIWLKADAGYFKDAGVTLAADGDTIQQWNDQSGNNNHFSQATAGNRPTYKTNIQNGKPVLRPNGTTAYMIGPTIAGLNTASISLYVVASGSSVPINQERTFVAVNSYTNGFRFERGSYTTGHLSVYNNGPSLGTGGGTLAPTGYAVTLVEWIKQYTTRADLWINGANNVNSVNATVCGSFTNSAVQLMDSVDGDDTPYAGDFCEVLLWNVAHSAAQRGQVENYLNARWAIY